MLTTQISQRLNDEQRQQLDRILGVLERVADWLSPLAAVILIGIALKRAPDLNRPDLNFMIFLLMWIGLTSSWNIICGYTGYIDFGHTVFVGLGAYVVAVLMVRTVEVESIGRILDYMPFDAFNFWNALPFVFVFGALLAVVVGYPALRLKGPYFAIAMLGTFVAGREVIRNNPADITKGGIGVSFRAPFADDLTVFYTMLVLASVMFFLSLWVFRTQLGLMLQAIRDDEVGADMRGINTTLLKITMFAIAGGVTAMLGATRAWSDGYTDPIVGFPSTYTIQIIMMAMLGGIGRPWGPVLGAALFYYAERQIWANLGGIHLAVTGVTLAFIVLFMPAGILGLLDPENRGLRWRVHQIRKALLPDQPPDEAAVAEDEAAIAEDEPAAPIIQVIQEDAPVAEKAASNGRVVLEGRRVVKDFGGLRAVNEVNFKVHEGEIVGLLGPNGSGKTTLFNCICGVNRCTSGHIYLNGEEITTYAPWQISRRFLSRTFQKIRIFDKLTVVENMLLGRQWRGVPFWLWLWIAPGEVRRRVDELIHLLRLSHVRDNLASNLSGGQQRLLEIGVSLMGEPAIVLLDEATSGVNPALVEEIKADIRRLNREHGVTFFLVEHNMSFAMELCERLYVLDYGSLIAEGTPEEIQSDASVIEAYFGRDE